MTGIPVEQANARVPEPGATQALRAYGRLGALFVAAAAALFVTAGTWQYWEARAWLVCTFAALALVMMNLLARDPEALASRLEGAGRNREERQLARWFAPLFVLAFLVPGLDTRFGWSDVDVETVPKWLALVADTMVVLAILFGGYVVRMTAHVRRTRAEDGEQALLSTGPYHVIRHPLAAASLLAWVATPVALGSWMALPVFLLVTPYYFVHLRQKERQLARQLPGYGAYCKRTPFRLVPFVW